MKKILSPLFLLTSLLLANEDSNLMTLGVQASFGTANRTFENTTGSKNDSYNLNSYKLLIGKDWALYGTDEQTSRFYLAYKYNDLAYDTFGNYNVYSIGYLESMNYLALLNTKNHKIVPIVGLEIGYANANNGFSENGFNGEFNAGLAYQFYNMEVSLAYTYNYLSWDNSQAKDDFNNHQATLGFTYKIITGDK